MLILWMFCVRTVKSSICAAPNVSCLSLSKVTISSSLLCTNWDQKFNFDRLEIHTECNEGGDPTKLSETRALNIFSPGSLTLKQGEAFYFLRLDLSCDFFSLFLWFFPYSNSQVNSKHRLPKQFDLETGEGEAPPSPLPSLLCNTAFQTDKYLKQGRCAQKYLKVPTILLSALPCSLHGIWTVNVQEKTPGYPQIHMGSQSYLKQRQ